MNDLDHRTWVPASFVSAPADLRTPGISRTVVLDQPVTAVRSATLRWTARGVVEARINGMPVTDALLVPGWTTYERRLRYREDEVTALMTDTMAIEFQLAPGWYAGRLGFRGQSGIYGTRPALLARLEIAFDDGRTQVIATDESWDWRATEVRAADLYDGQVTDARVAASRASSPASGKVARVDAGGGALVPHDAPAVRRTQLVRPQRSWRDADGTLIVDFGQNLVGFVRVEIAGPEGHAITVRHAEVLEDGRLALRPLRTALATDTHVLSGGADVFEPTLTFHGFRYAGFEGWPDSFPPVEEAATAVVVGSELERTGYFTCSDPALNRLHENVVWGLRGNFVYLPTDCPQRDERLGWTGDIAVFAPTAAFLFDVQCFLGDWLRDVAAEQEMGDGRVPHLVPDVLKYLDDPGDLPAVDTAIWGDAAVWVPWALWTAYGDAAVLRAQYASMTAHGERVARLLSPTGLWEGGFQFGDWLDPMAPPDDPFRSRADTGVVATACAFRTFSLLAETSEVLGERDAAARWRQLAASTREGFRRAYVRSGRITSDCEAVYALAIAFDVLDASDEAAAGRRLAELVEQSGFRVMTGFAGTPYLLDALARTGHLEHVGRVLLQTEIPSWLYPVTMGATTIWERWDSMLPDGSINPGEMTSFNHYAFGAVADFLHRRVGGIAPATPGYGAFTVDPLVGLGGLRWAETSLETSRGVLRVRWERLSEDDVLEVDVPEGTIAHVDRSWHPGGALASGRHVLRRRTPDAVSGYARVEGDAR